MSGLANIRSAAPGLRAKASPKPKPAKKPKVVDRVCLDQGASLVPIFWGLALTATGFASMLHFTGEAPSAILADWTGSESLQDFRELSQFGDLQYGEKSVSPEEAYQELGTGDSYYSTRISLDFGESRVALRNRDQVSQLADYLTGQNRFGLDDGVLQKFQDLHGHPDYRTDRDQEGFLLALDLADDSAETRQAKIDQMERYHDFYFGSGDEFSEEERELLPLVVKNSNLDRYDGVEIVDQFAQGKGFRVRHQAPGQDFEVNVNSREEMIDFARRLQGQLELDQYQPAPERLQRQTDASLERLDQVISVSRAQLEALEGLSGVDRSELDALLEELGEADTAVEAMRLKIAEWPGGDPTELFQSAEKLKSELAQVVPGERERLAWWNSHDAQRGQKLNWNLRALERLLGTTKKDAPPAGWQPPALSLEQ